MSTSEELKKRIEKYPGLGPMPVAIPIQDVRRFAGEVERLEKDNAALLAVSKDAHAFIAGNLRLPERYSNPYELACALTAAIEQAEKA